MEPEGSLPHSQVPATCPYPEPARSSPYPPHPISWRSILILSSNLRLGLPSLYLGCSSPKRGGVKTPLTKVSKSLPRDTASYPGKLRLSCNETLYFRYFIKCVNAIKFWLKAGGDQRPCMQLQSYIFECPSRWRNLLSSLIVYCSEFNKINALTIFVYYHYMIFTSTHVFLGFPVSTSKCWDGSQNSKLPLHASHVALQT